MTKITLGQRPTRPEGMKARGLTTELWCSLTKCWHENPEDRITISEILELLNSTSVLPLISCQVLRMCSRCNPSSWTEGLAQGASRPGSSAGGATVSASTSIRRRPSSTRDWQRPESHTGRTSRSFNDRTHTNGLSEKMGAVGARIETPGLD